MNTSWIVHKFGGSSVADAACFRRVAAIIEADPHPRQGVVLSAARGVTDMLLNLVTAAEHGKPDECREGLDGLRARHMAIADDLLSQVPRDKYRDILEQDLSNIAGILATVRLIRSAAQNIRDLVAGYGEIWSTRLFAALMAQRGCRGPVQWLDARKVVVVEWGLLGPTVLWDESRRNLALERDADAQLVVITGFVAADRRGIQTTLGRNGSDFSGSIFGALLDAEQIVIWTDVDGVLSADPRRVPDATIIDALSYNEAMELAYFGAKVIHPATMAPAVAHEIPIWIKNTFAPERPGTLITARPDSALPVKGITSIEDVALVNLEGAGMIGVPGTAHRLFGALRDADISVILISQGSSEHSICFAIPMKQASAAEAIIRNAFDRELRDGQIGSVQVTRDATIIAVVGDGMAGTRGVAAKVCGALGNIGVNIRAIAQGASERNISLVIDGTDSSRALRAVHTAFYLSPHTVSIGLVGPGTVGGTFLDQLASQIDRLRRESGLDLRVRGILRSRTMILADAGVDLGHWREAMAEGERPTDLDTFVRHVHAEHLPHAVIIDCSASAEIALAHADWLARGIHVVTANKKAGSAPGAYIDRLNAARRLTGSCFLAEATVGAGLPVMTTLRDLRETGDRIREIEGIFSGTLAYLFNRFDGTEPFSALVQEAKAKGYTEPDPRDDLSGMDVARKLTILAREAGYALELDQVVVESLVPTALVGCDAGEYLRRLPEFDDAMAHRVAAAAAKGQVLRYVGRLTAEGQASVGIRAVDRSHVFAHAALTDNVVRFATDRYCDNPLVVQGPGAGPAVTAAAVFGDLLRLATYLGARL